MIVRWCAGVREVNRFDFEESVRALGRKFLGVPQHQFVFVDEVLLVARADVIAIFAPVSGLPASRYPRAGRSPYSQSTLET
jgi:hypothetical protein